MSTFSEAAHAQKIADISHNHCDTNIQQEAAIESCILSLFEDSEDLKPQAQREESSAGQVDADNESIDWNSLEAYYAKLLGDNPQVNIRISSPPTPSSTIPSPTPQKRTRSTSPPPSVDESSIQSHSSPFKRVKLDVLSPSGMPMTFLVPPRTYQPDIPQYPPIPYSTSQQQLCNLPIDPVVAAHQQRIQGHMATLAQPQPIAPVRLQNLSRFSYTARMGSQPFTLTPLNYSKTALQPSVPGPVTSTFSVFHISETPGPVQTATFAHGYCLWHEHGPDSPACHVYVGSGDPQSAKKHFSVVHPESVNSRICKWHGCTKTYKNYGYIVNHVVRDHLRF